MDVYADAVLEPVLCAVVQVAVGRGIVCISFLIRAITLSSLLSWTETRKYEGGPVQFKDASDELMMLPTDLALTTDPEFK